MWIPAVYPQSYYRAVKCIKRLYTSPPTCFASSTASPAVPGQWRGDTNHQRL